MKPDELESKLQRQSLRQVPDAWRAEILAATTAAASNPELVSRATSFWAMWFRFLTGPQFRWGALAGVWAVIFALNHSTREAAPVAIAKAAPPSPQMILALREQRLLLAELVEPQNEVPVADRPKVIAPRPQSQRPMDWATV